MARTKKEESGEVKGRALVDVPRLGLKCGEYYELNTEDAKELEESGEFDTKADK